MDDEGEVASSGGTNGRAVLVARLHGGHLDALSHWTKRAWQVSRGDALPLTCRLLFATMQGVESGQHSSVGRAAVS